MIPIGLMGSPQTETAHLHEEQITDTQGRVLEHRKFSQEGRLSEEVITRYDGKGRPLSETARFDDGETEEQRTFDYDDAARTQVETVWYSGEPGERIVAYLDEHGHSMREEMYDPDGELELTITYAYHKPGLIAAEDHIDAGGEPFKRTRIAYDELDRPAKVAVESDDMEDPSRVEVYTYSQLEEIMERFDEDGRPALKQIRTLNAKGLTEKLVIEDDGEVQHTQTLTYDAEDRPERIEWINAEGQMLRNQTFTYDGKGRVAEETFFEYNPYSGRASHFVLKHEYSE
jgi:hypothetical protein